MPPLEPMRFGDSGAKGKRRMFEFSHLELDFITARFIDRVELESDLGSFPSLPLTKSFDSWLLEERRAKAW